VQTRTYAYSMTLVPWIVTPASVQHPNAAPGQPQVQTRPGSQPKLSVSSRCPPRLQGATTNGCYKEMGQGVTYRPQGLGSAAPHSPGGSCTGVQPMSLTNVQQPTARHVLTQGTASPGAGCCTHTGTKWYPTQQGQAEPANERFGSPGLFVGPNLLQHRTPPAAATNCWKEDTFLEIRPTKHGTVILP
jgi:hypothetical protein